MDNHDPRTPWRDIALVIEPHLLDVDGNHATRLLDIDDDGEPAWVPKEDAAARLTNALWKLWAEKGDYAKVTVESLRREEDVQTRKEDKDERMDVDEEDADDASDSGDEGMKPEDILKLKDDLKLKLQEAHLQLLNSQTLIALLQQSAASTSKPSRPAGLPSLAPPEGPPLDGLPSISPTLTSPQPPSDRTQLQRAQLATGLKNTSLRRAASVFINAAQSVEEGLEKEGGYFRSALGLRERWRLAPRAKEGARRVAVGMGMGGREPARDFAVHYGMEGGPIHQRRSSVAYLSPLHTTPTLIFPTRAYQRLSLTLIPLSPTSHLAHLAGTVLPPPTPAEPGNPDEQLAEAQREVLDREVFESIRQEVAELVGLEPVVREEMVSLRPTPELEMRFELVTTASLPSAPPLAPSPTAALLLSLLLTLHLPRTRPSLLRPILPLFTYLSFCLSISAEFSQIVSELNTGGVHAAQEGTWVSGVWAEVWSSVLRQEASEANWGLGGSVQLALRDTPPILLTVSHPPLLTLHPLTLSPNPTRQITTIPELREAVALEVVARLGLRLERAVRRVWAGSGSAGGRGKGGAEWVRRGGRGWVEWADGALAYDISLPPTSSLRPSVHAVYTRRLVPTHASSPSMAHTPLPATPATGQTSGKMVSVEAAFGAAREEVKREGEEGDEDMDGRREQGEDDGKEVGEWWEGVLERWFGGEKEDEDG